eukprot:CAMPEP_0197179268 /NCGR_PEP_ID=MMETSP1423-20130617/4278_1 /TAXON_ID=476441 /ORGANISM="Pseudo-nitzschia heimii, Strain UNC1101" /LENGTH=727 /DNA_ID=CAMNT_0042629157 /DNA_START=104 /DNA_END=2287 /DNA_ORIENTATION=+
MIGTKNVAGRSFSNETKKGKNGNFSLKTVVKNLESQGRQLDRRYEEERDIMKLAKEEVQRKHEHMKRRMPYQRAHHKKARQSAPSRYSHRSHSFDVQNHSKANTNTGRSTGSNITETDRQNAPQNNDDCVQEPKSLDSTLYFSEIAPGDSTTGDDFLSHFKMEMSRGINKMFGCPKLVKFEYHSNDTFDEATMEFSTPFEAQRVLKSTFCYYRGKPLKIELGSQLSSERLHSVSISSIANGALRTDQNTYERDLNDNPRQDGSLSGDIEGKQSRSHPILIPPHESKNVIELHDRLNKGKEGVNEPEENNLKKIRGDTKGNKSINCEKSNGVKISTSTEIRRGSIGRIKEEKQDRNPEECTDDKRFSKQTFPPASSLDPTPDHVLSLQPHPKSSNSEKKNERHTPENEIDDLKQRYERAKKDIQERKNSFAQLSLDFKQEQDGKIEAQNALVNAESRLAELSSINFYMEKRNDVIQRDYESVRLECEEKQKNLTRQNTELQNTKNAIALKLDQKDNTLEKCMTELKSLRAEKDLLVNTHSKFEIDLAQKSNRIETQLERLGSLEMENANLKEQIDALTKDNQVHKKRLGDTILKFKELSKKAINEIDDYEMVQKTMEEKHKLESEQARKSVVARSTISTTSNVEIKMDAATTRLEEQLMSKTKEHNELQQNFNTIAMQNFRQSNTIEEQRVEIRRLQEQLGLWADRKFHEPGTQKTAQQESAGQGVTL